MATLLDSLRGAPPKLSVGILAADMMDLGAGVRLLESVGVPLLHLDVMDGRVWPKITAGSPVLAGLRTSMFKDVHLLIEEPEKQIESFAQAGADVISFSVERCRDASAALDLIGSMKNANDPSRPILRGVSLDPATPVDSLAPLAEKIDVVLLLAVGPSSGKQIFLDDVPGKIAAVRALNDRAAIFVDGGVTMENIGDVARMMPDVIVTGSAAFAGDNPEKNVKFMLEQIGG